MTRAKRRCSPPTPASTGSNCTTARRSASSGKTGALSVVEGAVVGSATIHAPEGAYVALPDVASADAAIVIGATLCEYGAGLTAFGASASSATEVALAWTASDPDRGVLLERRVDGAWTTLAFVETGAPYTTSASPGRSYYRAYDGDVFLYADIWSALGVQFRVASTWVPAETATQNWEVLVQNVTTTERVMPGQGITLLARIYDAFDEDAALLNDGENVVSVKYACYFNSNGLFEEANEPVAMSTPTRAAAAFWNRSRRPTRGRSTTLGTTSC